MIDRAKPPLWFWIAGVVLLLWGLMGVVFFQMDVAMTSADLAKLDPYDRQLYASRPSWLIATYGVAVWAGLLGSVLLLLRRSWARSLYLLSLVAIVVLFGFELGTTDLIAHKGFLEAAGFPIVIALIAAFEILLATRARRRGWIG